MPRLSTLSNPTGLVDIERQRVTVILEESGKHPQFSLAKLDTAGLPIPADARVVLVARRGNAEERVELGGIANWNKGYVTLMEMPDEGTWLFRVLVVHADSAKLAGAAEGIRPQGNGDSQSFIALEPADLGQRPWQIVVDDSQGQVIIRFNRDIYRSAAEAEADPHFTGLLLPEAARRLAAAIVASPGCLEDEVWRPVQEWLAFMRVADVPDTADESELDEWCDEVVANFCNRFEFATRLRDLRGKESEE